ncbi:hypothetical protein CMK17_21405, partial [Candidatus Poribacteria bacterium]|nr:hypothetical protein [Candidatus Poribacteria bacterium]
MLAGRHGREAVPDSFRAHSRLPQGGKGEGLIAGGQPLSGSVPDEFVMEVEWFGALEENLQEPVDVGGGQEILAPGDEGDLLLGVVHH